MALLAILALAVSARASAAVPERYLTVLERRGADETRLAALHVVCDLKDCRLDGRLLTPEDLDALLTPFAAPPAARSAALPLPPALPVSAVLAISPDSLFDGARRLPSAPASAATVADAPPPAPPSAWTEPPFDDSWSGIEAGLAAPKTRARALKALAARFQPVEDLDSKTGLSPEAPEALRLLAKTIHDGRGGPAAAVELKRELTLVADLEPPEKAAFARQLQSPLVTYVALARSRSSHALDSQLYFARLERLLATAGETLPDFIRQEDPQGRDAAAFLLRCHSYDVLIGRLNRHPAEAGDLAAWLFPEESAAAARARAAQLEGFMTQLATLGRKSGALAAFVTGLEARASGASDAVARRVALYLAVNEASLPKALRPSVETLAGDRLPAGLLRDEGLQPREPYDLWPKDRWTFALHFASTDNFKAWQANFAARGYEVEESEDYSAVLSRTVGALTVTLRAELHPGDEEGFLRGDEYRSFLSAVAKDLRDPAVQGVILRNHAQFHVVSLFDKRVTPGKLLLDGSCRSAWDLASLRKRCPTCSFIMNTGTGFAHANNEAVAAVLDGLANLEDWSAIGAAWSRHFPVGASRVQGPWTPPYGEALQLLEPPSAAPAAR